MGKFEFEGEEDRRKAKAKKKLYCIEWRYNPPAEVLAQLVFTKPFDWTSYRRYGTEAARDQAFDVMTRTGESREQYRTMLHYEYRKGEGKA